MAAQSTPRPRSARTARVQKFEVPDFGDDNFEVTVENGVVTIRFAVDADLGVSSTGKTRIVTRGPSRFFDVPGTDLQIPSFMAYRTIPKSERGK